MSVCRRGANEEMGMVSIYGKKECALCEAAKSKLRMMGVLFESFEIKGFLEHHDGWRNDGSVEIQACYQDIYTLPVILIDGKAMSYPAAMKLLKPRVKKAEPAPVVVDFVHEPVEELAVAVG